MFKLHFGRLTGKACTKGECVLRFEAIAHNTAELRCGRVIDKFPQIVTQLARIASGLPPPWTAWTPDSSATPSWTSCPPAAAGIRSPRMGRKPAHWTRVDRDYERIRIDIHTLFNDLAIETPLAA